MQYYPRRRTQGKKEKGGAKEKLDAATAGVWLVEQITKPGTKADVANESPA